MFNSIVRSIIITSREKLTGISLLIEMYQTGSISYMFNDTTILVTGGTGSFGKAFVRELVSRFEPKKVVVW